MHFPEMKFLFASAVCLCAAVLTTHTTAQPFTTIINVPPDVAPNSIGSDTQLNLFDEGLIDGSFKAGLFNGTSTNIEVNVYGGFVRKGFKARSGSTINIYGGHVAYWFDAYSGSTINVFGGSIGSNFDLFTGSTMNVSGGVFYGGFEAHDNNLVNITGGTFGDVSVQPGWVYIGWRSSVDIGGGTFLARIDAMPESSINIRGTFFVLDGNDITTDLATGTPVHITDRDVVLAGTLADGSSFSFDLNSVRTYQTDYFDIGATLTITLVPEPGTLGLIGIGALGVLRRRWLN